MNETAQARKAQYVKLAITILVTVTLLAVVLSQIDMDQFGQAWDQVRWGYLPVLWRRVALA